MSIVLPTSEGIWRWRRKDDGREFDLPVYNVAREIKELYFRVYFLGGYYDIEDFTTSGQWIAKVSHNPDGFITKQISGWIHPEDFQSQAAA